MMNGQINGSQINGLGLNSGVFGQNTITYSQQNDALDAQAQGAVFGSCAFQQSDVGLSCAASSLNSGQIVFTQDAQSFAIASATPLLGYVVLAQGNHALNGSIRSLIARTHRGQRLFAHGSGSAVVPHGPGSKIRVH